MTHTRSAVALGAMLMATAASAQVQNGNFATDLSHWEQHGHKRATMGTAANPKIPKNFAELGKSCKTLRNVWYMSACNGILTGHEAKQP